MKTIMNKRYMSADVVTENAFLVNTHSISHYIYVCIYCIMHVTVVFLQG